MLDTARWLLVLAVICLLLIGFAVFRFDQPWEKPTPHSDFVAMEVGGAQAADDTRHWGIGLALGIVMITMLTTTLNLATADTPHRKSLRLAILVGGVMFVTVFVAMMFSYRDYAASAEPALWGPFPAPTNWLVFGIWMTPAVFTLIYVVGFHRWFALDDNGVNEENAN